MLQLDWNIIWTIINIIILYVLLRRFLFDRVQKIMKAREDTIRASLDQAKHAEEEAAARRAEYEKTLQNVEQECDQIRKSARQKGEEEYRTIIDTAKTEAQKQLSDAQTAIRQDREKAASQLKSEIAQLAVEIAGKISAETVSGQVNQKLLSDLIGEVKVGGKK